MNRESGLRTLVVLFGVLLSSAVLAPIAGAVHFAASHEYATGVCPQSVAIGDFDGDGWADVVTANADGTVSMLIGNAAELLHPKTDFPMGTPPRAVAVGDFNGDNKRDLVTANNGADTVSVLLGNGDGTFAAGVDFATGVAPVSIVVADLNGDGKSDIATTNFGANTVSVLLGDGSGGFGAKIDSATGLYPNSVAVGDFNGDAKPDLVTTNWTTNTVSVLLGDGGGGFPVKTDLIIGTFVSTYPAKWPKAVAVGDFNEDGKQDFVTANNGGGDVSVLLGDGSGGFAAETRFWAGSTPSSIVVGDLDGDRHQDLAVANTNTNCVSVLVGDGLGGFGPDMDYPQYFTAARPVSLVIGEINRGRLDLVTANSGAASVSVLQNTSEPRSYAMTPTRGRVFATVTITGWGFGVKRGTNKVFFGSRAAIRYISWSKSKIRVKVPITSIGRKAVRVKTANGRSNVKYFRVI